MKNPVVLALLVYFFSLFVSTILAENYYRAFWGDLERGEGVFGFIYFYLFFFLVLWLFREKEWQYFFKTSLAAGFILILVAFFEYFDWQWFFLNPHTKVRPESLLGNPALLAVHLIFLSVFSFFVYKKTKSKLQRASSISDYFWKYVSVAIFILSLATIFITKTRGALLGIMTGFVVFFAYLIFMKKASRLARMAGMIILISMIIFSVVFLTTRTSNFWQKIPGLDRLAKTATFDINNRSVQSRLITWQVSWEAFKERPIVGWGPENYIVAYEKYYDPKYALYGEDWFDRAHNKIFDILVMQGALGLVAYLGIFIFLLYLLFQDGRSSSYFKGIVIAGLAAYMVQNLVFFDQIISEVMFFALIGYVLFYISGKESIASAEYVQLTKNRITTFKAIAGILILLAVYSIYAYNFVPYAQAVMFKRSKGVIHNEYEAEQALKRAIMPYNFAQFNIRTQGLDTIYQSQYFDNAKYVENPQFRSFGNTLLNMIAELVAREPYDARVHIRLVGMLNSFAQGMTEEEIVETQIFGRAENLMREAIKLAPHRQEVYYHLAFNLAWQKKFDEAIEVAQYAINLEPRVARAHYHLALVLALAGRNEESLQALSQIEKISPNFDKITPTDLNSIAILYRTFSLEEKFASLIERTILPASDPNKINHTFPRKDYENAFRYYLLIKDKKKAIALAKHLHKAFPDLSEDMLLLIDLLEKEEWNIIDNLD